MRKASSTLQKLIPADLRGRDGAGRCKASGPSPSGVAFWQ
ncbi:hypothetical protein SZ55_4244 [Pseudomonas sp. FeS53a]|nr:hypothetical protein SZ55_4244 [Pseudomonas sp. FeS53a]